jgi:hypothetical protein
MVASNKNGHAAVFAREDHVMPMLTRRSLVLAASAAPFIAKAQTNAPAWPAGTIRIVVPYPPGGSTDVMRAWCNPACNSVSAQRSWSKTSPARPAPSAPT